ncbi:MAG TPA: hypothetical protein VFJ20_05360, partial [Gemmatimonadaceae bacterium]|nr:hypothetical protein [Gemmatimonadaceae bacterium]
IRRQWLGDRALRRGQRIDASLIAWHRVGAVAFPGWFRVYTVTSIVVTSALAVISIQYVSAVIANQPTPWMGAT